MQWNGLIQGANWRCKISYVTRDRLWKMRVILGVTTVECVVQCTGAHTWYQGVLVYHPNNSDDNARCRRLCVWIILLFEVLEISTETPYWAANSVRGLTGLKVHSFALFYHLASLQFWPVQVLLSSSYLSVPPDVLYAIDPIVLQQEWVTMVTKVYLRKEKIKSTTCWYSEMHKNATILC